MSELTLGVGGLVIAVAHPDDETFGAGGLTALLRARGVPVHIVIATDGDAGEITDPELDTPEARADLGAIRRSEARAAAAVLGADEVRFLGYRDGELSGVPTQRVASDLAATFAELQPAVVVTFGPDGIYGHPDHLAMSRAATRAFIDGTAGPSRLFYLAITEQRAKMLNDELGPIQLTAGSHPFRGTADHDITTSVDISSVRARKLEALMCHRTQTAGRTEWAKGWIESDPVERFVLARRRVADSPGLDADLFAGLAGAAQERS